MDDIDISRDEMERLAEYIGSSAASGDGSAGRAASRSLLALRSALDRAEASIVQWRADERETGEAYMRLRNIIGREAFRTPPGVSHFDVTESALKDALAARNVTTTITFDKTDIADLLHDHAAQFDTIPTQPLPPASPEVQAKWQPMPPPNDVSIIVLRSTKRLQYIEADDNDYTWHPASHYASMGLDADYPVAWMPASVLAPFTEAKP